MTFQAHIIGAGRGGTSLLMGLVDAHPDCEIVSEVFSTEFLMGRTWTPAENASCARDKIRLRCNNFLSACNAEASNFPGKIWGHKTTTEHILALEDLDVDGSLQQSLQGDSRVQFDPLQLYIEATKHIPTIFILRDGRSCVRSKVVRAGQSIETAIRRWKFSVKVHNRLKLSANSMLAIKFENLILEPQKQLLEICRFLEIKYSEQMLTGTQSLKMLSDYRRVGFDRAPVEFTSQPWFDEILPELTQCGYA